MGRMHVKMIVNGGPQAMLRVMDGLVVHNLRDIEQGRVPPIDRVGAAQVRYVAQPNWVDAVSTLKDGMASAGTLAAWKAASMRANYDDHTVRVGLVKGVPVVIAGLGGEVHQVDDPSLKYGRDAAFVQPLVSGAGGTPPGQITEYLMLDIDDEATAVRDVGDAIARHNASQIVTMGLPPLYESGIVYTTEGSPEVWMDAAEILRQGKDDCEGLAAYRAGEIIARGGEAGVWTRAIKSPDFAGGSPGKRLFHAITRVQTPNGVQYDDPSARLGMPVPDWHKQQLRQARR